MFLFNLCLQIAMADDVTLSDTNSDSEEVDTDLELGERGGSRGFTLEVEEYTQDLYPLLYSGMDKQLAINHASLGGDKPISSIQADRFWDATQNAAPKVLGNDAILIQCPNARSSMSRIRMLYQKGNNALNYYELDNAEKLLNQAAADILCLKDPIEIETISNIYFLSGIVNMEHGKPKDGYADFKRALTFTPDFEWNDNFSPDLRVQFDQADKDLATEPEHEIIVFPAVARKNVLVNGQELNGKGLGVVNQGMNVVQVFGEQVDTYFIQVRPEATLIELIIPETLPQEALGWIKDEQTSNELSLCLEGMYAPDTQLFLHDQGILYSHIIGSDSWSELKISSFERSTLWLRSERFAKGLQMGGLGMFAIAGSVSIANIILANRYNNQAQSTATFPVYDDNRTKYNNIADGHSVWVTSTFVGLGLAGAGFALSFWEDTLSWEHHETSLHMSHNLTFIGLQPR